MDFVEFQIRRIAEDLRDVGLDIPGKKPPTLTAVDHPEVQHLLAKEPDSKHFLDRLVLDHVHDPAYQVQRFFLF